MVDEEGLAFCSVAMFYALASAGRIDECAQYLPAIRAAVDGECPVATRQIAAQAMVDASMGTDAAADAVDEYVRLSEQMGEIQIARSWMVRGNFMMFGMDPPDLAGGIEAERTAIELATEVKSSEVVTWGKVLLAHGLAARDDAGARDAVRSAVTSSFDVRYLMAAKTAVEVCARYLVSAGDAEGASVLLGHLDRDAAPWSAGQHSVPSWSRQSPGRNASTNSGLSELRWTGVEPSSTRWNVSIWGPSEHGVDVTDRLAGGQ